MFYKGQKVVCINDDPRFRNEGTLGIDYDGSLDGLKKGSVYTVRDVQGDSLWVEEIVRGYVVNPFGGEKWETDGPYWPDRFRPVKKTNIDVFLKILADAPKTVTVE